MKIKHYTVRYFNIKYGSKIIGTQAIFFSNSSIILSHHDTNIVLCIFEITVPRCITLQISVVCILSRPIVTITKSINFLVTKLIKKNNSKKL